MQCSWHCVNFRGMKAVPTSESIQLWQALRRRLAGASGCWPMAPGGGRRKDCTGALPVRLEAQPHFGHSRSVRAGRRFPSVGVGELDELAHGMMQAIAQLGDVLRQGRTPVAESNWDRSKKRGPAQRCPDPAAMLAGSSKPAEGVTLRSEVAAGTGRTSFLAAWVSSS